MNTSGSVSDGIGSLHPSVIQSLNRKLHETHITEVLLRAGAYRTIQAVDKINIFYIIKISISRNFCRSLCYGYLHLLQAAGQLKQARSGC